MIPYYDFYNPEVEKYITKNIKDEYAKWKVERGFSLINYQFIYGAFLKCDIFRIESMILMKNEQQNSFIRAMFVGVIDPYLHLNISRDNLLKDTFAEASFL